MTLTIKVKNIYLILSFKLVNVTQLTQAVEILDGFHRIWKKINDFNLKNEKLQRELQITDTRYIASVRKYFFILTVILGSKKNSVPSSTHLNINKYIAKYFILL